MLTLATFLTAAALSIPVTVHDGQCPGREDQAAGCYIATENTIWVKDLASDRMILWHERGHAFDAQRLDAGERAAFSCLKGVEAPLPPSRCRASWGEDDLMEVFADAYANCAKAALPGTYRFLDSSDYTPTKRQHRAVCRFINRAAD